MDKEKKDFVLKRGVLGVGLPVAVLMSFTAGFQVPGYMFRLQAFNPRTFLFALVIFTPVFLIAGTIWGIVVYGFTRRK
jgi:hypothetical protein